jgi:lipopolysaccharide biosynthesis protein
VHGFEYVNLQSCTNAHHELENSKGSQVWYSQVTWLNTPLQYEAWCGIQQVFADILAQNVDATVIRVVVSLPFH